MSVQPGTKIGVYTIDREIGRGGMGVVYAATDSRLGRSVAIKALPVEFAADAGRLARFEREARTLASLSHANVAQIYGVEEVDGARYLVLEMVEGRTLADVLASGRLPMDESLEIALQIAQGLEAAHEAGVVHRDLKPGNVMVTPDGGAKILDFGLAKGEVVESGEVSGSSQMLTLSSPPPMSPVTQRGVALGTPSYMSPEQARGKPLDARTDIWSFGCVLYEMLTGSQAFGGETVADIVGATLHKELDVAEVPADTPPIVGRLLRRCLVRDRRKRLQHIADVRVELEEVIADPTASAMGLSAR